MPADDSKLEALDAKEKELLQQDPVTRYLAELRDIKARGAALALYSEFLKGFEASKVMGHASR